VAGETISDAVSAIDVHQLVGLVVAQAECARPPGHDLDVAEVKIGKARVIAYPAEVGADDGDGRRG
jgi:hypothetical protein